MMLFGTGITVSFPDLLDFYRRHLLDQVMPFWPKHAVSPERDGLDTCLADDGTVLSTDRYMWSQLRAIWSFSALYNRIEKRSGWLDIAQNIYCFARNHGRDAQGRWCYRLTADGEILDGPTSIYTDAFAVYGLTEYYRATGDRQALNLAIETFQRVLPRLDDWSNLPSDPYPIPTGYKAHAVSMIFSHVFDELADVTGDKQIADAAWFHHRQVMEHYLSSHRRIVFEYIGLDDKPVDSPAGRAIVPGHAIESMWFQIHLMQRRNRNEQIPQAIECIRRHMELGWDNTYGGLLLSIDADSQEPRYWRCPETKPWWIATEALYALLLAHSICDEPWCLDWYRRLHDYAFTHYPNHEHGEWHQRLSRQGHIIDEVIALPVKDPFHLPRAMIHIITIVQALAQRKHATRRKSDSS